MRILQLFAMGMILFLAACSNEDEATRRFYEFRKDAGFRLPPTAIVMSCFKENSLEGFNKMRASVEMDESEVEELGVSLDVAITAVEKTVQRDSIRETGGYWDITVSHADPVAGKVIVFFDIEQKL